MHQRPRKGGGSVTLVGLASRHPAGWRNGFFNRVRPGRMLGRTDGRTGEAQTVRGLFPDLNTHTAKREAVL